MLHIIDNQGAPEALIALAKEELKDVDMVESLMFTDPIRDEGDVKLGVYTPMNHCIAIDLRECFLSMRWPGMLILPNAWFNAMEALYHESAHARQYQRDPKLNSSLTELETDAANYAHAKIVEWIDGGNTTPSFNEMGYIATLFSKSINLLYSKNYSELIPELDTLNSTAVAFAESAARARMAEGTEEAVTSLLQCIEEKKVGVIINNNKYLTAEEYMYL